MIFGKNWTVIREGVPKERDSLIDSKIASLAKHRRSLDMGLISIRNALGTQEEKRAALKTWCINSASSPYGGPASTRFLNFLDYCVKEKLIAI